MTEPTPVVVTGLGLATAAGIGVAATWEGLCRGTSTALPDRHLRGLPVSFSCRVPDDGLSAAVGKGFGWRTDRFIQLALVAALEAVDDAGLHPADWDAVRVGVVIGAGGGSLDTMPKVCEAIAESRYRAVSPTAVPRSQPNMAAGEVAISLGARGPTLSVSTACASGATAIGVSRMLLDAGACDLVIAGGSDSACNPIGAVTFWRMGALSTRAHDPAGASRPFDADRDGFVLGEGAGVLVLERADHAQARRARVYARLTGHASTADAYHPTAPHPRGEGALRALRLALADAGLQAQDIDHVNAHGTSTPLNDEVEARVLRQVFPASPPVTATKSILGHTLGGAGAIEAVCCVLALDRQTIHPTANLNRLGNGIELDVVTGGPRAHSMAAVASNSFGFGGQNTVLIFQQP
ncbi:beta-ketoacyl-[acyl-carrier-protein] synthase family protein [Streptomyces sp. NPDC003016]